MLRYFFDVHDGISVRDEVGRALENSETILFAEALQAVTELMKAEAEDAREVTLILTVRDESGETLLKVRLVCEIEKP